MWGLFRNPVDTKPCKVLWNERSGMRNDTTAWGVGGGGGEGGA